MDTCITETIGCDLGDKKSELCIVNRDGQLQRRLSIGTHRAGLSKFFEKRARSHVIIEVGVHSRWVSQLLSEWGHRVTVANPRRVQLIAQSNNKSDRHDAELLARLGRADVRLLCPVQHRSMQAQADLAVPKARDTLVRTRTQLINHVRSVAKSFGQRLPSCESRAFVRRVRPLLSAELVSALEPMLLLLEQTQVQIATFDRTIGLLAKRYPEVAVVSQPAGVGTLTALVFILTLEDPRRFKKSRWVGAFLGLRPKRSQSGHGDPELHISKAGDPFLRRLLVQCAHHILGPFGQDSDLRRWGLGLAARGGKNAKKRARVAVARRLAILMHRLWVTGEVYEPLRQAAQPVAA